MGYLTKEIFEKPTLFSILCIIGIIVGIPYGIYGLNLKGGESLAGTLALVVVFILIIILAIDRGIVSKIKPLRLTLFELLLSLICLFAYQSNERKAIIDLENYNEDFFVVIYNKGKLKDSEVKSKFIFNKEVKVKQTCVVIPEKLKSEYRIQVLSPKKWSSLEMRPDSLYGYNVEFYNSEKRKFTETDINLIVKKEIANVTKKNYR